MFRRPAWFRYLGMVPADQPAEPIDYTGAFDHANRFLEKSGRMRDKIPDPLLPGCVILSAAEESHGVSYGATNDVGCSTGKENFFVPRFPLCTDDVHRVTS